MVRARLYVRELSEVHCAALLGGMAVDGASCGRVDSHTRVDLLRVGRARREDARLRLGLITLRALSQMLLLL